MTYPADSCISDLSTQQTQSYQQISSQINQLVLQTFWGRKFEGFFQTIPILKRHRFDLFSVSINVSRFISHE